MYARHDLEDNDKWNVDEELLKELQQMEKDILDTLHTKRWTVWQTAGQRKQVYDKLEEGQDIDWDEVLIPDEGKIFELPPGLTAQTKTDGSDAFDEGVRVQVPESLIAR